MTDSHPHKKGNDDITVTLQKSRSWNFNGKGSGKVKEVSLELGFGYTTTSTIGVTVKIDPSKKTGHYYYACRQRTNDFKYQVDKSIYKKDKNGSWQYSESKPGTPTYAVALNTVIQYDWIKD